MSEFDVVAFHTATGPIFLTREEGRRLASLYGYTPASARAIAAEAPPAHKSASRAKSQALKTAREVFIRFDRDGRERDTWAARRARLRHDNGS